jgi:hypothetical protein
VSSSVLRRFIRRRKLKNEEKKKEFAAADGRDVYFWEQEFGNWVNYHELQLLPRHYDDD